MLVKNLPKTIYQDYLHPGSTLYLGISAKRFGNNKLWEFLSFAERI